MENTELITIALTSKQVWAIVGTVATAFYVSIRLNARLILNKIETRIELLEKAFEQHKKDEKESLDEIKDTFEQIKEKLNQQSERIAVARDRLRISDD